MSSLKQLSPFRKMLGILLILVVMIVSLFVGLMAGGGPFWRHSVRSENLGHVNRSAIGFSFVTGRLWAEKAGNAFQCLRDSAMRW